MIAHPKRKKYTFLRLTELSPSANWHRFPPTWRLTLLQRAIAAGKSRAGDVRKCCDAIKCIAATFALHDPALVANPKRERVVKVMKFIRAVVRLYLAPSSSAANAEKILKRYSDHALWELVENTHPESVPEAPHGLPYNASRKTVLVNTWIPRAWLREGKRTKLLSMLYSLKRGYGFPCEDSVKSALQKHEETLTADCPDTTPLHAFAHDWAEGFANELAKLGPLPSIGELPSSSTACLEHSIKDGGRALYVQERIKSSPWLKVFETKGDLSDAGKRAILLHSCLEDLRDQGFVKLQQVWSKTSFKGALAPLDRPCTHGTLYRTHCLECGEVFLNVVRTEKEREVRVSPVLEQGYKVRPITVNNGAWATLMHLPRLWLFAMLGRCGEIPSLCAIRGKRQSVASVTRVGFKQYPEAEINSLDLTSATDNFSKSLCSALYEGFTRLCPPMIREIGRETFRPVTLLYRQGKEYKRVRSTKRGILMGDPCSWSILNLHNMFLWRLADEIDAYTGKVLSARLSDFRGLDRKPTTVPEEKTVVRCGDDQFAVTRPARARNFEALLTSVGALISVGAHFASSKWGFYTKCIYCCETKGKLSFVDYFPPRFVTGPARTRPGERHVPSFWNIGPAVRTGVSWFEMGKPERVHEFDHAYWIAGRIAKKPIRALLTKGVEPFLPRELGGFGLPDAHGKYIAITGFGKAVWDMVLRDDLSIKPYLLVHLASFIWSSNQVKDARAAQTAILFLREFYPSALEGFPGSEAEKKFGDPGNPLGISDDPKLPFKLSEAINAYSSDYFPIYEDAKNEILRVPAFWKIGVRFRGFASKLRTGYRAKHHALPVKAVEEVLNRATRWRCSKLPKPRSAEYGPGFTKVILADEGIPRKTLRSLTKIDFVPSPDLQRIMDVAGVSYPKTESDARKVIEELMDAREEPRKYYGTSVVSWKAILRAPPEPYRDSLRGYAGVNPFDRGSGPPEYWPA